MTKEKDRLVKEIASFRKKLSELTKQVTSALAISDLPGFVVDDEQAKKIGEWQSSTFRSVFVGKGYVHDGNEQQGAKTLTFEPSHLPPGNYEVRLAYVASQNRATNVPVTVFSADGETELKIDQQVPPPIDGIW